MDMHAIVALLDDVQTTHFETGEPVVLSRGEAGTVVMLYGDGTCEVEFADRSGRTYALLPLPVDRLLLLHGVTELG